MYHRIMAALVAAFLVTVGLIIGLLTPPVVAEQQPLTPKPEWTQVCVYEDSTDCTWDARHDGNNKGKSYVVVNGNLHRVPHAVAHYLVNP